MSERTLDHDIDIVEEWWWAEDDTPSCSCGCGCSQPVEFEYDRCAMCEEGCGPNEWGPDYGE